MIRAARADRDGAARIGSRAAHARLSSTPMHTEPAFLDSRDFARIARAIRFIDANFRAQPRLAAIAASAHLSEFHFNRLFRRWAGVTPRQYLAPAPPAERRNRRLKWNSDRCAEAAIAARRGCARSAR